jgi:hypothetical protein
MLSRRPARGKRVPPALPPCRRRAVSLYFPVNDRENAGGAPRGVRSADRAPTARHVEVAAFIVNNNPETMQRCRRSFPTAGGWYFARRAVAHECRIAALSCPGRSAARSGALQTPISGLPEIGDEMCASRVNPTCVDRSSLWRSRISGAIARRRRASTRLWPHFVMRCTASGTRESVGRVRSLIHFSNSPSRSRGAFASGFCIRASLTPNRGGGRSAERRSGAQRNTRGACHNAACQALARRLASHDAGRSPLGAPPWRFWAPGPRFPPRHLRRIGYSELLAARS